MSYKTKCINLYERHLREHFSDWNNEIRKARTSEILQSKELSNINSNPHAEKINKYLVNIISDITKEVYLEKLEGVIQIILKDVAEVIDDLLDEKEANQLYEFASSETGQKILRNLDLLNGSYEKGSIIITTELVVRWSKPEVANRIVNFISGLDDPEGTLL